MPNTQISLRLPEPLAELYVEAIRPLTPGEVEQGFQRDPYLARRALKYCIPAASDPHMPRPGLKVTKNVTVNTKLVERAEAIKVHRKGTGAAGASKTAVYEEALSRYLFFNRDRLGLSGKIGPTGYSEASPPPWPSYDEAIALENALKNDNTVRALIESAELKLARELVSDLEKAAHAWTMPQALREGKLIFPNDDPNVAAVKWLNDNR